MEIYVLQAAHSRLQIWTSEGFLLQTDVLVWRIWKGNWCVWEGQKNETWRTPVIKYDRLIEKLNWDLIKLFNSDWKCEGDLAVALTRRKTKEAFEAAIKVTIMRLIELIDKAFARYCGGWLGPKIRSDWNRLPYGFEQSCCNDDNKWIFIPQQARYQSECIFLKGNCFLKGADWQEAHQCCGRWPSCCISLGFR